jgi:hypothetical protein
LVKLHIFAEEGFVGLMGQHIGGDVFLVCMGNVGWVADNEVPLVAFPGGGQGRVLEEVM